MRDSLRRLTSFDVDILAPDLSGRVLGSAVVRVVVDQLTEAGRQEVKDLEGSVLVNVANARDIVDLLAGRQIPAQRGRRSAPSRTGHGGPCGAGKYYLLQRCIDKVQAGMKVFTENCRRKEGHLGVLVSKWMTFVFLM